MDCEKCSKEHDGSFGSGRFCSRKCSNSRIRTEETKRKIARSVGRYQRKNGHYLAKKSKNEVDEIMSKIAKTKRKNRNARLIGSEFDALSFDRKRKRVAIEQNNKCNRCELKEWLGEPIALELEHKDGNNRNNVRENLEMLCPNCHALTTTWRGRNKKPSRNGSVSDENLVRAYLESGNIRQALLSLGMAAKGDNYGRVKRALALFEVEYYKKDR